MPRLHRILVLCLVLHNAANIIYAQVDIRYEARWCVINDEEKAKCEALQQAIKERSQRPYPGDRIPYDELPELMCIRANDKFACMEMITMNELDLVQLDPGLAYTAGEYYNMLPLVAEQYNKDTSPEGSEGLKFYAVSAIRKGSGININNLKGKKSCHTGVGRAAGWVHPVGILIEEGLMDIVECNVPVKSAADYFGDMCAPDGLARYYNPFGNNPVSICENCKGYLDTFCNQHDPYAGYSGAFTCLGSGDGEVAFIRQHTIEEGTRNNTHGWQSSDFELLCLDGTTKPYDGYADCNWGVVSSHVIMTTAVVSQEQAAEYRVLLKALSDDFGHNGLHNDLFKMFDSTAYGKADVMFSDATEELHVLPQDETYYSWVGEDFRKHLEALNTCPVNNARWCVISNMEMEKCENMIMAFSARNLKPDLNCILGESVRDCMDKIREGDADLITLDASDVYTAGKYFDLVPIAAEDYSGYDAATYYAVAVARKIDSHLTIFNLKNRRSCHSAVMTAAGWIIPVDKLIETGQIHVDDGDVYFSVGQFFSKSCVPGVLHEAYNTKGTNPVNLCEACAAGGHERCVRNDDELYYGNSGAFRCLTEFGGEAAFVKHTTVRENTDGRNQAEWARNRRSDDYELLCNDGTRSNIDNWENCNMGELPANAICTAGFKAQPIRDIYWTLLNYAQQFFASDSNPDFQMFTSMLDHKDLLFQDSTVRLVHVEEEDQNYEDYLGPTFLRAMERMESIDTITSRAMPVVHGVVTNMILGVVALFLSLSCLL